MLPLTTTVAKQFEPATKLLLVLSLLAFGSGMRPTAAVTAGSSAMNSVIAPTAPSPAAPAAVPFAAASPADQTRYSSSETLEAVEQ